MIHFNIIFPFTVHLILSGQWNRGGYDKRTKEIRNKSFSTILVGKPVGKPSLGRPTRRWIILIRISGK
jgi:hypothetical protein